MKTIDRLLKKARQTVSAARVFIPFVVPDRATADRVWTELDEFNGDRPYYALIIYGEDELED